MKKYPCSWIRINIFCKPLFIKAIYIFNAIPYQNIHAIFHWTGINNSKIHRNSLKPWIVKAIMSKMNEAGGIILFDFRIYHTATVIKPVWYWHKNRYITQRKWIEILGINPCTYDQLIYYKGDHCVQWKKDNIFNKWCWEN